MENKRSEQSKVRETFATTLTIAITAIRPERLCDGFLWKRPRSQKLSGGTEHVVRVTPHRVAALLNSVLESIVLVGWEANISPPHGKGHGRFSLMRFDHEKLAYSPQRPQMSHWEPAGSVVKKLL